MKSKSSYLFLLFIIYSTNLSSQNFLLDKHQSAFGVDFGYVNKNLGIGLSYTANGRYSFGGGIALRDGLNNSLYSISSSFIYGSFLVVKNEDSQPFSIGLNLQSSFPRINSWTRPNVFSFGPSLNIHTRPNKKRTLVLSGDYLWNILKNNESSNLLGISLTYKYGSVYIGPSYIKSQGEDFFGFNFGLLFLGIK